MEKIRISAFRIVNVEMKVNDSPDNNRVTLSAETKFISRHPLDQNDKSGLMELETTIQAEDEEQFSMLFKTHVYFSFEEQPDNFDEFMKKECYPLAEKKLYKAIRTITEAAGLNPLDLDRNK